MFRDAIIIQSLEKQTGGSLKYSNVCGQSGFSDANAGGAITANNVGKTVCSKISFILSTHRGT